MNIHEVMRYLGYKENQYDSATVLRVQALMKEVETSIRPKWNYRRFEIQDWKPMEVSLKDCPIVLTGKSIAAHLQESSDVYLLCATLGIESERMLMRNQASSITDGMILDSCLSAFVEEAADACEEMIRSEISKERALTFRFSPGYGDLCLDIQKEMIRFLNWDRILGVTLTKSMMMVPSKSIIAIIGVEKMKKDEGNNKKMQPCGNQSCEACNLKDQCNWKK